jgi:broad specificity phosphatase PhoE
MQGAAILKGDRMPHPKGNLSSQLDYEGWRYLLRSMCGRYYSEGIEPNSFSGWVRAVSARGFTALDIGSNAQRVERRMGAKTTEIEASHLALVSHPDAITNLILEALAVTASMSLGS